MKKLFVIVIAILIYSVLSEAQEEKEMPKLDIPEITIVGKKAVTLPFARKDEILNIDIFEAPEPDTSIIGEKIKSFVTPGSATYHKENFQPWRAYIEGQAGNYSTIGFYGVAGYSDISWEASVRGGYGSTNGHVKNADVSRFNIGGDISTTLYTDNDFLKNFRVTAKTEFWGDTYGIFGFKDSTIERKRRAFSLNSQINSSEYRPFAFSAGIGLKTLSVQDNESEISAFSPILSASATTDIGTLTLLNSLSFEASSLDYQNPVESPNLLQLSSTAQMKLNENWSAIFGLKYFTGSYSDGGSGRLFSPIAVVSWLAKQNLLFSFWWEPDANIRSYIDQSIENPYLIREMRLRHELILINFGISTGFSYDIFHTETRLSYSEPRNIKFPLVKNDLIELGYSNAKQIKLEFNGSAKIGDNAKLFLTGILQKVNDVETDEDIPMTPLFQLQTRGEWKFNIPLKAWASINYTSSRKIDQLNTETLPDYFLLNAGVLSDIFKSTVISLETENLLGKRYDWWYGYEAPGIILRLKIQYSL